MSLETYRRLHQRRSAAITSGSKQCQRDLLERSGACSNPSRDCWSRYCTLCTYKNQLLTMDNSVQIIVTGFHRSGTSMTMQSLKKAGLHIGDSLLGAAPSNPDGHFEDIEAVKLHDQWLKSADTDWCCTEQPPAVPTNAAESGIEAINHRLSAEHTQWGLKDPRAALYLDEWFNHLSNPHAVLVYRHYASCANSLQRRQASNLLIHPSDEHDHLRFWADSQVALRSWLVHNQAILRHIEKHPQRSLLLSQESQIAGFNLPALVAEKFPVELTVNSDTGVDKSKTTLSKTLQLDAAPLKQQLEETWQALQELSQAPAKNYPTVEWNSSENEASDEASDEKLAAVLKQLHTSWDELGVPAGNRT